MFQRQNNGGANSFTAPPLARRGSCKIFEFLKGTKDVTVGSHSKYLSVPVIVGEMLECLRNLAKR